MNARSSLLGSDDAIEAQSSSEAPVTAPSLAFLKDTNGTSVQSAASSSSSSSSSSSASKSHAASSHAPATSLSKHSHNAPFVPTKQLGPPVVVLRNVSKRYKLAGRDEEVVALRNVSLIDDNDDSYSRDDDSSSSVPRGVSTHMPPIRQGEFIMIRGPSGGGKCWATGTKLMSYSGEHIAVEHVKEGSLLMGDDCTPRKVARGSLVTGYSTLFQIESQCRGRMNTWSCNEDHILVLQFDTPALLQVDQQWRVEYVSLEETSLRPSYRSLCFDSERAAQQTHASIVSTWRPFEWECSVLDFLATDERIQAQARMYRLEVIEFQSPIDSLEQRLCRWKNNDVTMEEVNQVAWSLGRWFATGSCDDSQVLRALLEDYSISTHDVQAKLLPAALLQESVSIRRHLLGGLIDACNAEVRADTVIVPTVSFSQAFVKQLCHLARSVGCDTNEFTDSNIYAELIITGDHIQSIPTSARTAVVQSPLHAPTDSACSNSFAFTIRQMPPGVWHGFTFEKSNGRCLLADGVVTHNTTLLNLLGTIDDPTSGQIEMFGHVVDAHSKDSFLADLRLNKIGFVFQTFNLLATMSAFENVSLPMTMRGKLSESQIKARALELLDLVGLSDRYGHLPSELSGGEQQRVTIARALSNEPDLLLLDEATGDLDSRNTVEIMDLILDINNGTLQSASASTEGATRKTTVIMVTHNPDLECYADRILYFGDGTLQRQAINRKQRRLNYHKYSKFLNSQAGDH